MADPQQDANPYAQMYQDGMKKAVPVAGDNYLPTAKPPGVLDTIGQGVTNLGKGAVKGALGTVANIDSMARQHLPAFMTNQNFGFGKPTDIDAEKQHAQTHGTMQAIGKGAEQVGEFMLPGAAEESAVAHLPQAARLAGRIGASALGSGIVNKAQGGDFGTGAAAGAAGAGIGAGLKAAAPQLAESALKVRGNQRLFGRTVGDAILNDTSGIRPETIGKSAQNTIRSLDPQLDAADQASAAAGMRGTLAPARQTLADTMASHTSNRAMKTAQGIKPISDFLTRDQFTGLPLAESQSAPGLRAMKRGLNEDFIHNWTLDQPPAQKGAARMAYGQINSQLHNIAPETEGIDQRISSLIPVKLQSERVASGAPIAQHVMGRIGAHTGAAAMGIGGAIEGRREGGTPGMIAGGITGLVAPELISSPEGQMMAARMMNKAVDLKPAVGAALQFNRKDEEK